VLFVPSTCLKPNVSLRIDDQVLLSTHDQENQGTFQHHKQMHFTTFVNAQNELSYLKVFVEVKSSPTQVLMQQTSKSITNRSSADQIEKNSIFALQQRKQNLLTQKKETPKPEDYEV